MKIFVSFMFVVLLLFSFGIGAEAQIPSRDGFVTNQANILSSSQEANLEKKLLDYRSSTGNEISVLIVRSLSEDYSLEDFGHDVFNSWGVGKKGEDNGVLFIVVTDSKKVRIDVGYGLEADLTDLECGRLTNKDNSEMSVYFNKDDFYGGVNAVIDGIIFGIGAEYVTPELEEEDSLPWYWVLALVVIWLIILCINPELAFWLLFFWLNRDDSGGSSGGGSSGGGGASGGW